MSAAVSTHHADLHSEDGDSIMTDEVEEGATTSGVRIVYEAATAAGQDADTSGYEDDAAVNALAGPSTSRDGTPTTPGVFVGANVHPSGPICEFGDRLGYTYFAAPVPTADQLNLAHRQTDTFWLTVDNDLTYLSFFRDTGPLNVGCLYRFCLHLHKLLENASLASKRIILFSSADPDKKANAAMLMALYAMIVLRWSPADALHPIACLELQPFRDAGYARADFHLSCQDVLFGARKAIDNRLLKLDEFDIQAYEYYEKVENGDWNYITPHFLAFASPVEPGYESPAGDKTKTPSGTPSIQPKISRSFRNVLDYFDKNNVKMVIRLNKKLYDEHRFTDRGIEHREMYFDDGTNPTMEMCRDFIDVAERVIGAGGVVAVHCKAGLGRTGTLIGAYLIYKYGFSATEVIGFMRLMRPGTCVGPQQHFMYENQMEWVRWGAVDRYVAEQRHNIITIERPITPPTEDEQVPSRGMATPRAVTPLVHNPGLTVPGQPRKTPGAKHRHAVAAPETVDAVNDDVFLDQQTVQNAQRQAERALKDRNRDKSRSREPSVILVEAKEEDVPMIVDAVIVSRNPAKENEAPQTFVRTASGLRQMTPPVVIDGHGVINHSAVVSINAPASPAKQAVSSRIAKSRQQRPLTIINDNRQADVTAYSEHASRTTGKSQSNVLDAAEGSGIMSSGERYNLRTGRLSNPLTAHTGLAANNNQATRLQQNGQIRPAPRHTTASPTRLPQRIPPAKAGNAPSHQPTGRRVSSRKAAAVSAAKTTENLTAGTKQGSNVKPVVSVTSAAPVTSRPATGLGRAPRRRRSSTGDV